MFRACYARFRTLVDSERSLSRVTLDRNPQGRQRGVWGRKREEFIADFQLIARRILDPWHSRLFRLHHILGADVALCARRLRVSRAIVYHGVYRLEALLGLAFATTEPYALYPLDDYFHKRSAQPVAALDPPEPPSSTASRTLLRALRERHDKIA